jgi:hypothetical protein
MDAGGRAWERAEAAGRALKQARWQGRSERKLTQQLHEAWAKAFQAFKQYEKRETAWKRVESALDVFRPPVNSMIGPGRNS